MGAPCETGEIEHQLLCVQERCSVSYGIYRACRNFEKIN